MDIFNLSNSEPDRRRAGVVGLRVGDRPGARATAGKRHRRRDPRYVPPPRAGVVDSFRHLGGGLPAGPRRDGGAVRTDLVLGRAGVHHDHAHPARRSTARCSGCPSSSRRCSSCWWGWGCYGLYSIVIPVYAFLSFPRGIALAGDYKRFLERTAKIQSGLLICVYCLSYCAGAVDAQAGFARSACPTAAAAPDCCSSSC